MYEILGRDELLRALDDNALKMRVLDQQPKTLDDALNIVSRMEAYSIESPIDDNAARKSVRQVWATSGTDSDASRRINSLEGTVTSQRQQLQQQQQQIQQLKLAIKRNETAANWQQPSQPMYQTWTSYDTSMGQPVRPQNTVAPPMMPVEPPPTAPPAEINSDWRGGRGRGKGQADRNHNRNRSQGCYRCGSMDHYKAQCLVTAVATADIADQPGFVQGVTGLKHAETYIEITLNGRKTLCLLDSDVNNLFARQNVANELNHAHEVRIIRCKWHSYRSNRFCAIMFCCCGITSMC